MWARHRTKTHKPPCQAYYRIIVSFTITMVFTNYADGRSSRKDARRRKGSSSRVGSHRGTWYTAINTSTDRLKLTMTKRNDTNRGQSRRQHNMASVSNISGGFAAVRTTFSHGRCFTTSFCPWQILSIYDHLFMCLLCWIYENCLFMASGILRNVHRDY